MSYGKGMFLLLCLFLFVCIKKKSLLLLFRLLLFHFCQCIKKIGCNVLDSLNKGIFSTFKSFYFFILCIQKFHFYCSDCFLFFIFVIAQTTKSDVTYMINQIKVFFFTFYSFNFVFVYIQYIYHYKNLISLVQGKIIFNMKKLLLFFIATWFSLELLNSVNLYMPLS